MSNTKTDSERIDKDDPAVMQEEMRQAQAAAEISLKQIGQRTTEGLQVRGRGRPPKQERKVSQTLRLDPDVLEAYKREGKGWQARINEVLGQHMPGQK